MTKLSYALMSHVCNTINKFSTNVLKSNICFPVQKEDAGMQWFCFLICVYILCASNILMALLSYGPIIINLSLKINTFEA